MTVPPQPSMDRHATAGADIGKYSPSVGYGSTRISFRQSRVQGRALDQRQTATDGMIRRSWRRGEQPSGEICCQRV